MLSLLTRLLAGPLINSVMGVINKHYDVKMNKDALQADVEKAVMGVIGDVSKSQADVIKTEMQSDSWLARNWRPMVALSSFGILCFYALFVPITVGYWGWSSPKVGDALLGWINTICLTCLGGYMGLRTVDKLITSVFRR